jgi:indole-3-glycerol phosphate synthase
VHERVGDSHEIVLRIDDEDHLTDALEEFDAEIFILAAAELGGEEALEHVLDLLPDVPAGKLAIAELPISDREEIAALERAGIDGVVVEADRVRSLAGDDPPEV